MRKLRSESDTRSPGTFLPGVVIILLAILIPLGSCNHQQGNNQDAKPKPAVESGHVDLVVEFEDGATRKYPNLDWQEGMTVLDLMQLVEQGADGIEFNYQGTGETAFLTELQGVKNQGGGTEKKNWQFWVNDKRADRGMGIFALKSSDKVVWKFSTYTAEP